MRKKPFEEVDIEIAVCPNEAMCSAMTRHVCAPRLLIALS